MMINIFFLHCYIQQKYKEGALGTPGYATDSAYIVMISRNETFFEVRIYIIIVSTFVL